MSGDRKHNSRKDTPTQKRYTAEARWIKNRARRIKRHLKRCPDDKQAAHELATNDRLWEAVRQKLKAA